MSSRAYFIAGALAVALIVGLWAVVRNVQQSDVPHADEPHAHDAAAEDVTLQFFRDPKPMPSFTVTTLDGRKISSDSLRGKVVLVNFWATWCPPCREEMPAMERLWQHHKDQGFVIVAVSLDADPAVVKPFVDQHKLTFPVALDPKMDLGNAYGVRALPSSFIVDTQGYLAALALGPRPWDNDASHSLVEGLLR